MKLRSLVLALIAVISASAMAANTCDESFSITGFKVYESGYKDKTATGKIGDLNSTTAAALINNNETTKELFNNVNLAVSMGINSGKIGTELTSLYTGKVFTHSFYKNNPNGKANIVALVSGVSSLSAKVKECEAFRAVDPCDAIIASLEQAIIAIPTANPTPTLSTCPDVCKTTANKNLCDQKYQAALLAKQNRDRELGNQVEDGSLEAWERVFDAIPYTASPIKDGVDTLGQLKDIKSNFRQQKNIAKVSELEAKVRDKFPKPCFNAKFESTQQPKDNALNGLKELKQTYTIQEIETILNNADYYNYINVSTSGGRVVEDHVSICALVWMISAYNKNVGDSHEKREALASLLTSKFGEKTNGQEILTNLNKFSVPTTVAKLSESTQKINITKIDSKLIEDQIKKHLTGYRTPVTQQTSSEFSAWLDETFPVGATDVTNENFMELISKLLSLSSYSNDDVDVVVEKIFAKFGSTSNDIDAVRTAIINAKNNKTSVNVKALINSLIRNTNIDKAAIGGDDGINYIADEVSGTPTVVSGTPAGNPSGGNPSGNPSSGNPSSSQSPDVNGDGKFSSTEVSDFVEAVTQVSADNVEDLVSMLLSLENYDEATLDAIVDSILNTFGAKGDPETNKTAIVNAIIKAKNSKSKADIQALVQALIDNTNIDVADLGGASAASTIANNIVASPVVKQKSYSLDEVKGRVDGTGTVTPKQKSYNFQEIMDAVDGK